MEERLGTAEWREESDDDDDDDDDGEGGCGVSLSEEEFWEGRRV